MELEVPRPEEEMEKRQELADRVKGDPGRNAMEKETSFNVLGDEKFVRFNTAKPSIVRSLLEHDYAEIWTVCGEDTEGSYASVTFDEMDWSSPQVEAVHSISGTVPLNVLTIKGKPRSSHAHSRVVNTPSDVERGEGAFADD